MNTCDLILLSMITPTFVYGLYLYMRMVARVDREFWPVQSPLEKSNLFLALMVILAVILAIPTLYVGIIYTIYVMAIFQLYVFIGLLPEYLAITTLSAIMMVFLTLGLIAMPIVLMQLTYDLLKLFFVRELSCGDRLYYIGKSIAYKFLWILITTFILVSTLALLIAMIGPYLPCQTP
jgi:hypothetical protein